MNYKEEDMLLDACILAGKILMENGAEMHRVEDTMNRMLAVKHGTNEAMSFVIPTGIFVTTHFGHSTKMKRISSRRQNMEKIGEVNRASREFSAGILNIEELYQRMGEIEKETPDFPQWLKIVAAGCISGAMMLIFQGSLNDMVVTIATGLIGYWFYTVVSKTMQVRFLQEFMATFLMATFANYLNSLGLVTNIDTVIIGSIIVLVPGIQIMNSIRDFLVGNTISGTVFMIEAIMIAGMIGAGVMSALRF
ncbi:threonine/serine exporter family protein [Erysipelothrix sp. HDW6C]|uniref:threonine/serine exporter family protein n=1 Tax=Erysipelothrix sp. HDW6C TaxID=2714930 RepID=UPI0014097466|nr:threonine/serine exporter family protein [Erysipelothrix sp. HDW6C]QIK68970.1 threonine/serine exporter family protein [Erysipelothrix sp. HDW6C]